MAYNIIRDEEGKHFLAEINGTIKASGEMTDKELQYMRLAGKRIEKEDKHKSRMLQMFALQELEYRGEKLRKIEL